MIHVLLFAVLSFQDSQPASRPTYTREEFDAKIETLAAASNTKLNAANDLRAVSKKMEETSRWLEADPDGTRKKLRALLDEATESNERSYDAFVEYLDLQADQKFIDSIKRYGAKKDGWYGVSLGRADRDPNAAVAVLTYDGPPLVAAKLVCSWVDGFGDVVGSTTDKLTDIPRLPVKPGPKPKKLDRKYDFETLIKMIGDLPPVTAFVWIVSNKAIPLYAAKPTTTTFRIDAVVNVKKEKE